MKDKKVFTIKSNKILIKTTQKENEVFIHLDRDLDWQFEQTHDWLPSSSSPGSCPVDLDLKGKEKKHF
jgi:hypothetical protein